MQSRPDFWSDQGKGQRIVGELKLIRTFTEPVQRVERLQADVDACLELAKEFGESEVLADLERLGPELAREIEALDLRVLLGEPHDGDNAFVSINAGAGGVDACDWARMLLRMYLAWAKSKGFDVEEVELASESSGGIRSATIEVRGPLAFGHLKAETGVHRLVRISPFDSQARRHTAFASVDVTPELEDEAEIEVKEADLEVETMRSGGAGGQHVNKTESAVRMRHLPSGIVVRCETQRSQHKNREVALKMIKAKLLALQVAARDKEMAALYGQKGEVAFGSQIRSYVLHPYQMVKDHRTEHETGNIHAVLDGKIDPFIEAWLRQRSQKAKTATP
jgi:peptide chain release factor 2